MVAFKVGDLVLMNSDSWWLASGGSRYKNYTDKDRLVLVIKNDLGGGFFYGRLCSTGEERLWSAGEFELASKP
jgi:hypothetical protein